MACFMNLFTEQREGGEHTSRYLRLAVETSSLVSLVEKRPSLLTISSQRRSSSTPFRIPSCPAQKSKHVVSTTRPPRAQSPGAYEKDDEATQRGAEPGRVRSWRRGHGAGTPGRRGRGAGGRRRPPALDGGASATASCSRPPPPPPFRSGAKP